MLKWCKLIFLHMQFPHFIMHVSGYYPSVFILAGFAKSFCNLQIDFICPSAPPIFTTGYYWQLLQKKKNRVIGFFFCIIKRGGPVLSTKQNNNVVCRNGQTDKTLFGSGVSRLTFYFQQFIMMSTVEKCWLSSVFVHIVEKLVTFLTQKNVMWKVFFSKLASPSPPSCNIIRICV